MLDEQQVLLLGLHLHWLSRQGQAALRAAVAAAASAHPSPQELARALGLRDRYRLKALLRREGLPPARQLLAWLRVLTWLSGAEQQGRSLCAGALDEGLDPAPRYRLVRRLLGCEWSVARSRGFDWAVTAFADTCTRRARSRSSLGRSS